MIQGGGTQAQLGDRLAALVAAETQQIDGFVALLQREQEYLIAGQAEPLLTLAEEKTRLARGLQSAADARKGLLARAGRGSDGGALAELLGSQHAELWQRFTALARQAQELNQQNGKLIAERMQHNQQALAVLLSATEQALVYGPDGQARPRTTGRLFGAA